jgi:hypothetical protein
VIIPVPFVGCCVQLMRWGIPWWVGRFGSALLLMDRTSSAESVYLAYGLGQPALYWLRRVFFEFADWEVFLAKCLIEGNGYDLADMKNQTLTSQS